MIPTDELQVIAGRRHALPVLLHKQGNDARSFLRQSYRVMLFSWQWKTPEKRGKLRVGWAVPSAEPVRTVEHSGMLEKSKRMNKTNYLLLLTVPDYAARDGCVRSFPALQQLMSQRVNHDARKSLQTRATA